MRAGNRSWVVWLVFGLGLGCSASGPDGENNFTPPEAGPPDVTTQQDAAVEAADGKAGSGGTFINPESGIMDHWDPAPCFNEDQNNDQDQDGYSIAQGDCNDCEPLMNPGVYDLVDGIDGDCNGVVDDDAKGCDAELAIEGDDPMDAARALGLCRAATAAATGKERTWGVLSAKYVFPDGSTASKAPKVYTGCQGTGGEGSPPNPLSHGVLPSFGKAIAPRQGNALLALSSGVAREGVNGFSPGGALMCTKSDMPPGFPTPSTLCANQDIDKGTSAFDGIALEVTLRVPTNAKGFSFDFNFHTYEFPDWVCNVYNDYFVTLLWPPRAGSAPNNNISFDSANNAVSVNNALLEVCAKGTYNKRKFDCPLGITELDGTGFEGHGATGWLRTSATVTPGEEITLRFAVWDSVDESADATVVLDNFVWTLDQMQPGTIRPPK